MLPDCFATPGVDLQPPNVYYSNMPKSAAHHHGLHGGRERGRNQNEAQVIGKGESCDRNS